jgi:hypothetical protein
VSRSVELRSALDVPAVLARDELARIMRAIAEHLPPYEDATLHVGLQDLRLPFLGDISVPIEADVDSQPLRYACKLKIAAGSGATLFPAFSGAINVSPVGSAASELWLQGQYDVPLGALGAAVDATLLRGVAERSLGKFLDFLAKTIVANVGAAQKIDIRHRQS